MALSLMDCMYCIYLSLLFEKACQAEVTHPHQSASGAFSDTLSYFLHRDVTKYLLFRYTMFNAAAVTG